jgi:hypothetical protein
MDNRFDRKIIQEFFQKCIEINARNNPEKSAEIEKIEEELERIEKSIKSLEREITEKKIYLQCLTFDRYFSEKIGLFSQKNSLGKKLSKVLKKQVLKDNAFWLLVIFTILIIILSKYLVLIISVTFLLIMALFLFGHDKFKNEQDKFKKNIQLAIVDQQNLESARQSLERDKLIKEKEYHQYRRREEQRMGQLEKDVQGYLQSDRQYVLQKSAQILNFELPASLQSPGLRTTSYSAKTQQHPIVFCTGIAYPSRKTRRIFSRGRSMVANRDLSEVEKLSEDPLIEVKFSIPSEGLRNSFSGRNKYYQFYSFEIILLGSDFLCYYSCLWDFLRGDSVDVTTVEYFYDSIASIKTQERSSLRQKSSAKKRIYWDMLSISTFDGTVLYIRQEKDRSDAEGNESELNKAAREIRQWLRRRKEQTYSR